jgi:hypothetical protein
MYEIARGGATTAHRGRYESLLGRPKLKMTGEFDEAFKRVIELFCEII